MDTNYPKPQIGYYYAECCLMDLSKIENAEQLKEVEERIEDNYENGELMVFTTLKDAIECFSGDGFTPEQKAKEYARLGWIDTQEKS